MESRAFALITGLFVLGISACIVLWAQWLAKVPLDRVGYRVVSTTSVSGLNPEAQVRYRGMSVGRVKSIGLDRKDPRRILVDIEVNDDIPIKRSTYAQLGMEGITGIAYVQMLMRRLLVSISAALPSRSRRDGCPRGLRAPGAAHRRKDPPPWSLPRCTARNR
jgi:ABC-type transporter Mla subunit MlaD